MSKLLKKIKKAFKKKPKEQWRMNSIRGLERITSSWNGRMRTESGNPERIVPTFESQTTEELERKPQADRDEQFIKSVNEEMRRLRTAREGPMRFDKVDNRITNCRDNSLVHEPRRVMSNSELRVRFFHSKVGNHDSNSENMNILSSSLVNSTDQNNDIGDLKVSNEREISDNTKDTLLYTPPSIKPRYVNMGIINSIGISSSSEQTNKNEK